MNCNKCKKKELHQEFNEKVVEAFSRNSNWFVRCKVLKKNVEWHVARNSAPIWCPLNRKEN